jgi:starch synthase
LGDALEGLPAALAARGHEVSVVVPCYAGFADDKRFARPALGITLSVQVGWKRHDAEILVGEAPNGVQLFLIRRDEYFARSGLYGEGGRDYEDNAERFIYFSHAIVELVRRIVPPAEILHVHDWHTALVPVLIKERRCRLRRFSRFITSPTREVFPRLISRSPICPANILGRRGVEFYGRLNLLKGGILFADKVTTVSERYAREIQTPEYGCGLDAVIRENGSKISGILNGAEYSVWNPASDPLLPRKYTPGICPERGSAVIRFWRKLDLAPRPTGPVFAMVSRLAEQKGLDLLIPVLDRLLADDVRIGYPRRRRFGL